MTPRYATKPLDKPLEDLGFPKIIYKYRNWFSKEHREFLEIPIIFLASPKTFKDEKDCISPVRYDNLSESEIYTKCFAFSLQHNTNFTTLEQHKEFANNLNQSTPLRDKKYIEEIQQKFQEEYNNMVGILSLTANNQSYMMWHHYSSCFHGICIGYDSLKLFNYVGGGGEVSYQSPLPELKPAPFSSFEDRMLTRVYTKEFKWKFEEEFRCTQIWEDGANISDRRIEINPNVIKEVILGYALCKKSKDEILSIIRNKYSHVKVKRATYVNGEVIIN